MRERINNLDNRLKKYINIKTGYLLLVIVAGLIVTVFTTSYAMVTASVERSGAVSIVTGNLYSIVESVDFNKNKQIVVDANSSFDTEIRLSNINTRSAKLNLYYTSTSEDIYVFYDGNVPPGIEGRVFPAYTDIGGYEVYDVEIVNPTNESVVVSFATDVGLDNDELILPEGVNILTQKTCLYNGLVAKSTDESYFVMTNTGISATRELVGVDDVVIPCMFNGEEVTSISDNAFYNLALSSISIPDSVTTIGVNAFSGNYLSNMSIPSNVKSIGNNAFANNDKLLNINVNNKKSVEDFDYLGEGWNGSSNIIFK